MNGLVEASDVFPHESKRRTAPRRYRERFARARAEGDLPSHADPATLARYVVTVVYGIAVEAATGTPREALRQIIDIALRDFPADHDGN